MILACRDLTRGNTAADEIKNTTKNSNVLVQKLDLASQKSVREFADNILKTEQKIDVLINNAGMFVKKMRVHCLYHTLNLKIV